MQLLSLQLRLDLLQLNHELELGLLEVALLPLLQLHLAVYHEQVLAQLLYFNVLWLLGWNATLRL